MEGKKMKTKWLMIGDWLEYHGQYYRVLQAIEAVSNNFPMLLGEDFWDKCGYNGMRIIDGLEYLFITPIPITSKILHDIGFSEHKDFDGHSTFLNETELHDLSVWEQDYKWRILIQQGSNASVSIGVRYVHELQHAMRLVGLTEMADGFKL